MNPDAVHHALISSLALVGAIVCFALSGRAHLSARASALGWLLLGALVLRVSGASVDFLHAWDERYHALVAKHMMDAPFRPSLYASTPLPFDLHDWKENAIWLHKPPLSLWLMAGSFQLFGASPLAARMPSILLGVMMVALTWTLAHRWFGARAGWFAGFFHATSGFFLSRETGLQATDHPDVAIAAFIELAVYCAATYVRTERRRHLLGIAVSSAAAVLSKWLVGLLAFPVFVAMRAGRASKATVLREVALAFLLCVSLFLPWTVYTWHAFPEEFAWEQQYNAMHLLTALEGHEGTVLYHVANLFPLFAGLAPPLLAWFFLKERARAGASVLRGLLAWCLLPYVFFTFVATKMEAYVLPAAPAIFIMEGAALDGIARSVAHVRWKRVVPLIVPLALSLSLRFAGEKLRPFKADARYPSWQQALRKTVAKADASAQPSVVFGEPHAIEAMFESPHVFYTRLPTGGEVSALASRGYRIYVVDQAALAPELRDDPRLVIIH